MKLPETLESYLELRLVAEVYTEHLTTYIFRVTKTVPYINAHFEPFLLLCRCRRHMGESGLVYILPVANFRHIIPHHH